MTFAEMIKKIERGDRFSFSRWGDGEFNAIFQDTKSKANCDKHTYFKDMGERLLGVLKSSPKYSIGLQGLAYKQRKSQIDEITLKHHLTWCNADIIHRKSARGGLEDFIRLLKSNSAILVGGEHLSQIGFEMIKIPSKDCWLEYGRIKDEIGKLDSKIVLYAASMMSEVLIDDFKDRFTQIDVGSALDPYSGIRSRKYHHNLKI